LQHFPKFDLKIGGCCDFWLLDERTKTTLHFPYFHPALMPDRISVVFSNRLIDAVCRACGWHLDNRGAAIVVNGGGTISEQKNKGRGRVAKVCVAYIALTIAIWIWLELDGDRGWIATLALFGPLWMLLLPTVMLVPIAIRYGPRSLWILLVALSVVVGPIMGLCLPWRLLLSSNHPYLQLRILTCNTHEGALNADAMANLVKSTHPDIVAFQEWTPKDRAIIFDDPGWHLLEDDGFCLASRLPAMRVQQIVPQPYLGSGAAIEYDIVTPRGTIEFVNAHLASPHGAFRAALHDQDKGPTDIERNCQTRLRQIRVLENFLREDQGRILLTGDLNTRSESPIFPGSSLDVSDAFTNAGFGLGWTYYSGWTAIRIDHVLISAGWQCRSCWVGPDVGSPHRPVIADVEWIWPSN
jgi:vancomycin resistance protein VanJ